MNIWIVTNGIAAWLIPPGCVLWMAAWGVLRLHKRPRSGKRLLILSFAMLWVLSMPWFAHALLQSLEPEFADPLQAPPAQAVVVLGGGKYHAAPEYGSDTVSEATLVRLRYAAYLQRQTGKPLLVSGGSPEGSPQSEAQAMKAVLENEFSTPVTWAETTSNNTRENARASHALLAPLGINRVYMVTHAWHMPRAQRAFAEAGFDVVPAPTHFTTHFRLTPLDFMPQAQALRDSSRFFHEILGLV
ncbi:MAG TPA: YdcF family protein, partial [Burkholderiales bacterium]|nr:YdcF family protein [Burkholderiales bacterium]